MSHTETADRLLDLLRELGSLQATTGEIWLLARDSASDGERCQVDDLMSHATSSFIELRGAIERIMADALGDYIEELECTSLADDPCSDPDRWIAPNLCEKESSDAE